MASPNPALHTLAAPGASARPRIRLLPDEVKSRIAAGEVIERPASVLKELVENALDAGARNIHVQIEAGGRELIRVADDGAGMGPEDLALSVRRHATSKLTSADDLYSLTTLGFRGEALPSIGSVSRLSITTRPRAAPGAPASDEAWLLRVEGGTAGAPAPAAGSFGTTVEVRELFYNLPARKKFLKGPGAEAAACGEMLLRLALVRPDAAFTLIQGRQEILRCHAFPSGASPTSPASQDSLPLHLPLEAYARRAAEALGRQLAQALTPVVAEGPSERLEAELAGSVASSGAARPGYRLFGLLTPPAQTRPTRAHIYMAVNGRPVKDRTLTVALLEAYRHLLPPKRYPAAVLFLELPGGDVDINVHPTKAEVRFRIPGLVFSLFHHAVREAFAPHAPDTDAQRHAPGAQDASARRGFGGPSADWGATPRSAPHTEESSHSGAPSGGPETQTPRFDLWQGERTVAVESTAPAVRSFGSSGAASKAAEAPAVFQREAAVRTSDPGQPRSFSPDQEKEAALRRTLATCRVLGQAGGAYIVAEDESGVKLFDQHALHERILFEDLMAKARARAEGREAAERQGLLLPETLELSPAQAAVFADPEARAVLEELGYDVAVFGPRTVAVQAVPAVLKGARAASLVREVLEALAQVSDEHPAGKRRPDRAFLREKAIYTLSCKGAIKAGEQLTPEQAQALLQEFLARIGTTAYTCPHGRPLAVELTWDELERRVGRT